MVVLRVTVEAVLAEPVGEEQMVILVLMGWQVHLLFLVAQVRSYLAEIPLHHATIRLTQMLVCIWVMEVQVVLAEMEKLELAAVEANATNPALTVGLEVSVGLEEMEVVEVELFSLRLGMSFTPIH
jgi:hypothetical protein